MKKKLAFLFFFVFFLSLVSALGPVTSGLLGGLNTLLELFTNVISTILNYISIILFDSYFYGEFIYTKMLLFFLLMIVIYLILRKNEIISKSGSLNFIVALIISILSVRYLPDDLINGIIIPYGALAVAILVFIPLLIFFFWLHGNAHMGSFGRRAGWVIYAAAFIALWYNDANRIGITNTIYWIGIGFVVVSLILDGKVHAWLGLADYRRSSNASRQHLRDQLELQLEEMRQHLLRYERAGMTKAADDMKIRIEKMEKRMRKTFR